MLNRTQYFVKEHVGMLKIQSQYDIIDPNTSQQIGSAHEKRPIWAFVLGMVIGQHAVPTKVELTAQGEATPTATISRGFTFLRSKINVTNNLTGQSLGYFKSKLLTINGGFMVFDNNDKQIAEVKGSWKSWDFKFIDAQNGELGVVSKKWAGIGKELFTSADNYMVQLHDSKNSLMLLMAALALDTVFAENES